MKGGVLIQLLKIIDSIDEHIKFNNQAKSTHDVKNTGELIFPPEINKK